MQPGGCFLQQETKMSKERDLTTLEEDILEYIDAGYTLEEIASFKKLSVNFIQYVANSLQLAGISAKNRVQ